MPHTFVFTYHVLSLTALYDYVMIFREVVQPFVYMISFGYLILLLDSGQVACLVEPVHI